MIPTRLYNKTLYFRLLGYSHPLFPPVPPVRHNIRQRNQAHANVYRFRANQDDVEWAEHRLKMLEVLMVLLVLLVAVLLLVPSRQSK